MSASVSGLARCSRRLPRRLQLLDEHPEPVDLGLEHRLVTIELAAG